MKRIRRAVPLALAAALVGGSLGGCGTSADRTDENAAQEAIDEVLDRTEEVAGDDVDVEVDRDQDEVTITDEDGTATVGTKVPDGWPSSVPLPDGLVAVVAVDTGDEVGVQTTLSGSVVGRDFDDVVDEVDSELIAAGWTPQGDASRLEVGEDGEISTWTRTYTDAGQMVSAQVQLIGGNSSVMFAYGTDET